VFLFDEPNSALTSDESDELFREIHRLADAGRVVILVTHRLSDLVEHTDRVAVVRDGRVTAVLGREALTEEAVAHQLVLGGGLEREANIHRRAAALGSASTLFRVSNWSHVDAAFSRVEFAVERGEIVALIGVEGSGARELLRSFAGLDKCLGEVVVDDARGATAVNRFTAYVPATRQQSLYTNLSVGENLLVRLGHPEIAGVGFVLLRRRMRELAVGAVKRFMVKAESLTQAIRSLSGGNQQKVAIAQALVRQPKVLLLEEPTRGVDIGSKREIYRLLREFVGAGNSVVMYCTEVLEVFEAADRVFVVADGSLSKPLDVEVYQEVEPLAGDVARLERPGVVLTTSKLNPANLTRETREQNTP
jgi:ABC-type sugar transport system ATPase subunit